MRIQEIRLRRQPQGRVAASDFELADVTLPVLGPGDVLVRNAWMSVDPYMRLLMTGQEGFVPQKRPGDVMDGAAIGLVERSKHPDFPVGTAVRSMFGWRSHFVASGGALAAVDDRGAPLSWHLGLLGLTGVTAWLGIERVLRPRTGETILVSGAAGAVGSIAVQLARRRGVRVLATCSSAEKARWLLETTGVHAALNYREETVEGFLNREAPDGLDCYFDNVGGDLLDRTLPHMKAYGRVGLCGAMAQYETGDYRRGPVNFFAAIERSLTLTGFNAFLLSGDDNAEIVRELNSLARDGRIQAHETVVEGLQNAGKAFSELFDRGNPGKVVIKI
ncbi:MAG: NADP-dependent oxidoreductase [Pseudomonadota bacterium]